jgi:hypothetical protein
MHNLLRLLTARYTPPSLGGNYPKPTDQSILSNGYNIDQSLCSGFDSKGNARGVSTSIVDNIDYGKC